jgi:hypothetical protein
MPNPVLAVAGVKAAGSAISGSKASKAAKKAAETEAAAQEKALALQKEMFDRQVALQEPFRQAGLVSQNELMRQMGLGGDAASQGYGNMLRDFSMADYEADPGYAFRLQDGLKGLDRQAAARGGLISGAALKAASDFAGKQASAEYQNAYNRYNQNRGLRYDMLTGQQGVGANSVNALGGAARNYATQGGENIVGAGQARATGYQNIAAAKNAMIGGLTDIGSQLAGGYGSTWGKYASPAASQDIASGWSNWKDPTSAFKAGTISY